MLSPKLKQRARTSGGFSLLEAVVSMGILAAGVVGYVQSSNSGLASNTDSYETQRVAMVVRDINRMFAAHMAELPSDASQGAVNQRSADFRSSLLAEFAKIEEIRGYECKGYDPKITTPRGDPDSIKSSIGKNWLNGPAGCLTIHLKEPPKGGVRGQWIETKIHWVGLRRSDDTRQRVTTSALMLP